MILRHGSRFSRCTFLVAPLALCALLLLSGCGGGNVLGQGDNGPSDNGGGNTVPQPSSETQVVDLTVLNTGNANIAIGNTPGGTNFQLDDSPNGRYNNFVEVVGSYDGTLGNQTFASTFTLGNSSRTDLRVGDTVDLSVFRATFTRATPGQPLNAWRTRSGTATITGIFNNRSIYSFSISNVVLEPDPAVTPNGATGTFTVNGTGHVVLIS